LKASGDSLAKQAHGSTCHTSADGVRDDAD
jgi:hypothetical protein